MSDEQVAELMDLARENERAIAELRTQVAELAERVSRSVAARDQPRSA